MKRSFKLGAMAVACAAGVMVSAGAANFTSSADRLHEVGAVFLGQHAEHITTQTLPAIHKGRNDTKHRQMRIQSAAHPRHVVLHEGKPFKGMKLRLHRNKHSIA